MFTVAEVQQALIQALRLHASADIELARTRVVINAKDLCALFPWQELRKTAAGVAGVSDLCGVISVRSSGDIFWYTPDLSVSNDEDMEGRKLYTIRGDNIITSGGSPSAIEYWSLPQCATSTETTASVGLPSITALMARCVMDCVDLMDRKVDDAVLWQKMLADGMAELRSFMTPLAGPRLVTKAGRVFFPAPIYLQTTQTNTEVAQNG